LPTFRLVSAPRDRHLQGFAPRSSAVTPPPFRVGGALSFLGFVPSEVPHACCLSRDSRRRRWSSFLTCARAPFRKAPPRTMGQRTLPRPGEPDLAPSAPRTGSGATCVGPTGTSGIGRDPSRGSRVRRASSPAGAPRVCPEPKFTVLASLPARTSWTSLGCSTLTFADPSASRRAAGRRGFANEASESRANSRSVPVRLAIRALCIQARTRTHYRA
jgi:hypothetical protein